MDAIAMSITDDGGYLADPGGSFTEDAPRPPVPGEEGEALCSKGGQHCHPVHSSKNDSLKSGASVATPRRPDLDLGYEPEGSASPSPPYVKWAESLHSLLDDQDGILLFTRFLKQENCADMLDFWFACSGFRKLEANEGNDEKKLKLAKAIYKKYILDNGGIVSRQIKPATKCFIKDCVTKLHVDPAMFDQAQTEIQSMMEEKTYPLFLKSDVYLEYTRTGGESPNMFTAQSSVSGNATVLSGYLPTLNEDEEWRCDLEVEQKAGRDPTPCHQVTQKLLMETTAQHVTSSVRLHNSQDCRYATWREPVSPYWVSSGFAVAPATSTNDSEQQSMSSDADTTSLTDSSVDGVPPYRYRKQHRREMHESAKANGRLHLPHIPRTQRIPKEVRVEPRRLAAELISRLEGVLREREAQERLEERLQRAPLEDDNDISDPTSLVSHTAGAYSQPYNYHYAEIGDDHNNNLLPRDAHEDDPESILDDHVQRVMKTPGCQSPGTGRHSPKPDGVAVGKGGGPRMSSSSSGQGKHPTRHGLKGEASHLYHHKHASRHLHPSARGKPEEQPEMEAPVRVHGGFPCAVDQSHYGSKSRNYADGMSTNSCDPVSHRAFKKGEEVQPQDVHVPPEEAERNQKILQWMMDGEKDSCRHKRSPYGSTVGLKKAPGHEASRSGVSGGKGAPQPWVGAQLRSHPRPSHPFIQDPTMPPNPAPYPLTQLEEVRRRLEEESLTPGAVQPKQRYVMEVIQRGRTAVRPALLPPVNMVPAVSDSELSESQHRVPKKPWEKVTVAYYFCGEPIPYRTSVKGRTLTLGHFKELLTKRGSYRFYFKKLSDEFDCGVVFEEIREDDAILPVFEEKIIGKVEKID